MKSIDNPLRFGLQIIASWIEPGKLIGDILRIGKKCVVSFPNFGHWNVRLQLLTTGRAPLTEKLPYDWYNTPNIRVISMEDFRRFSKKAGFSILKEVAINTDHHEKRGHVIKRFANLRATYGIFLIGKKSSRHR